MDDVGGLGFAFMKLGGATTLEVVVVVEGGAFGVDILLYTRNSLRKGCV